MPQLQITFEEHHTNPVMRLRGKLLAHNAQHVQLQGIRLLSQSHTERLVIDMTEILSVDTQGFGALVQLHYHAQRRQRQTVLLSPEGSPFRTQLAVNKLDEVLQCVCSV